jgi:hypothetical protein
MVHELLQQGNVYSRLASSIAPEIWGHEDIKKVWHADATHTCVKSNTTAMPQLERVPVACAALCASWAALTHAC